MITPFRALITENYTADFSVGDAVKYSDKYLERDYSRWLLAARTPRNAESHSKHK